MFLMFHSVISPTNLYEKSKNPKFLVVSVRATSVALRCCVVHAVGVVYMYMYVCFVPKTAPYLRNSEQSPRKAIKMFVVC